MCTKHTHHTHTHTHTHARTHARMHARTCGGHPGLCSRGVVQCSHVLTSSAHFPAPFAGRQLSFWKDHGPELEELFPPPQYIQLPSTKGAALIHEFQSAFSPILNESISSMEAMFDGSVHIVVTDWPSFLLLKAEYQAWSSTEYYSHNTQLKGGMTVKRFYCRCRSAENLTLMI